jgi:hypothetical protein
MLSKIILQHEQVIQELNILQLELDSQRQEEVVQNEGGEEPMLIDSVEEADLPLVGALSRMRSQTLRESKIQL